MEKHPETFYHYRDCWHKSFYLDTRFLRDADCLGGSTALNVGCISKPATPDFSVDWGLGFPKKICSPELLLHFSVKWRLGSICWAYKQFKASSLVFTCTKTLNLLILIWPWIGKSGRLWLTFSLYFPVIYISWYSETWILYHGSFLAVFVKGYWNLKVHYITILSSRPQRLLHYCGPMGKLSKGVLGKWTQGEFLRNITGIMGSFNLTTLSAKGRLFWIYIHKEIIMLTFY